MTLHGHMNFVTCIVVLRHKIEKIVSGSDDTTIRIFDSVTGKNEFTLIGHTGAITN